MSHTVTGLNSISISRKKIKEYRGVNHIDEDIKQKSHALLE